MKAALTPKMTFDQLVTEYADIDRALQTLRRLEIKQGDVVGVVRTLNLALERTESAMRKQRHKQMEAAYKGAK